MDSNRSTRGLYGFAAPGACAGQILTHMIKATKDVTKKRLIFSLPAACMTVFPISKMSGFDTLLRSGCGIWPPAILHAAAAFRAAPTENFSVVRGLGTWHCLPAGQPGHNGVPTPLSQGRVVQCAADGGPKKDFKVAERPTQRPKWFSNSNSKAIPKR